MRKFIFKQYGLSFIEMLVALSLTLIVIAAGGSLFTSGNAIWDTGNSHVRLRENLRYTLERIGTEVRTSNSVSGEGGLQIVDGGGLGSSDTIKFSVPVVCETGGSVKNSNSEVANWGAPLTWGCKQASCMDADNDCDTVDYKYVSYGIYTGNKLKRSVLDSTSVPVVTLEMGAELTDLQFSLNGSVLTITATAQETEDDGRVLTEQASLDVYLRN